MSPIHKKGSTSEIENYRPVAISSSLARTFESCLHANLFSQIKNLINPQQHGFFARRSTVTNLACLMEDAYETIKQGEQLDCIYTDFSKAFDRLDFSIVACKMSRLGFSNDLVFFFISYLTNRRHYVEYSGSGPMNSLHPVVRHNVLTWPL